MSSASTVLFVCEHGAAKSVIAAAYLARLADAAGRPVRALARGTDPEPAFSAAAVAGLGAAGLGVPNGRPEVVTAEELGSAAVVVSFGPDLRDLVPADVLSLRWGDVPAVSEGFEAARDAIVTRVLELLVVVAGGSALYNYPSGHADS